MYDEIVDRLNRISQFAPSTGVERGRRVLRNCGNPEKDLKIIHVAGTNGKGSTCAYIAQILQSNGTKQDFLRRLILWISESVLKLMDR